MTSGLVFFNFGGGCVVRLLVALHSLRKYYSGNVHVFIAEDDYADVYEKDVAAVATTTSRFNLHATVEKSVGNVTRNLKSVIKPELLRNSPYDHTLICDGDLLFQASPEPLLWRLENGVGFIVTQFSTWKTNGNKMSKRVQRAWDFITPADKKILEGRHPAINIGVVGWSKGNDAVINDWEHITDCLAGQHIADEIACQVVFHRHPHLVVGPEWNESCFYYAGAVKKAKILHFHGNKHCGDRESSRAWLQAFQDLRDSGKVISLSTYLTWNDKALLDYLRK